MSHTSPELPDYHFNGIKEDHHLVRTIGKPRTCTYCAYLSALNKGVGGDPIKVLKSRFYCFACGDFLCKDHEGAFHLKEEDLETDPVPV